MGHDVQSVADAFIVTAPVGSVTCAQCSEVQPSENALCARCGAPLGTEEDRKAHRRALELHRREVERNDVSIQRFPGFGTNGTPRAKFGSPEFFSQMSNQMRRRYIVGLGVIVAYLIFLIVR